MESLFRKLFAQQLAALLRKDFSTSIILLRMLQKNENYFPRKTFKHFCISKLIKEGRSMETFS